MQVADVSQSLLRKPRKVTVASEVGCKLLAHSLHGFNSCLTQTKGPQTAVCSRSAVSLVGRPAARYRQQFILLTNVCRPGAKRPRGGGRRRSGYAPPAAAAGYASSVRIVIDEQSVQVLLAPWQRALGLMRNISVPREDIGEVRVIEEPVREAMSAGMKVGLRVPWLLFVARTMRLDEVFVVRRGVPALSFTVSNYGALRRVLLSTPRAREFAEQLDPAAASKP
jgi:hypothetical protein